MPFKIVQTIEGGETCLSVVPSGWEVNGTLHWPKKHQVVKLSLQEDSLPTDNWQRINCIKKRQFRTYDEACKELDRMENQSDTEIDEACMSRLPDKRRRHLTSNALSNGKMDFNDIAEHQTAAFSSQSTNVRSQVVLPSADGKVDFNNLAENHTAAVSSPSINVNNQVVSTSAADGVFFLNTEEVATGLNSDQMVLSESAGSMAHNPAHVVYVQPEIVHDNMSANAITAAVLANQNAILANQSKIMQVMAKIVTDVEYVSQAVSEGTIHRGASISTGGMEEIVDPITSVQELDLLEENLKDDRMMQKYIRSMSFICGTSGKANGMDSCYKLVDFFLTRPFLLQCSWTGNSRASGMKQTQENEPSNSGDTSKVALKFYKKFRALFLKLVMLADRDFSEMECDVFFKRIIKNSKQRLNATTTASRHRNRPRNIKYKVKKPTNNNDSMENDTNGNGPSVQPTATD